jgi:Ca2+-binding RTX toxin-like protein
VENIIGTAAKDTLTGDNLANFISGGAGDDTIDGDDGDDTVDYSDALKSDGTALSASDFGITLALNGATNATVSAGSTNVGSDTVKNVENIIGTAAKDTLTGDNLANFISGGDGDDTILGGSGNDVLSGGAGIDTFIFASGDSGDISDTIFDVITDYTTGVNADVLDLAGSAVVQGNNSDVDVSGAAVGTGYSITASIANGIISLGGTDSTEIDSLAEWIAVARLMVVDNGGVGAFQFGGDTYVYQENTGTNTDLLIQLYNVTGVSAISATAAVNSVLIV